MERGNEPKFVLTKNTGGEGRAAAPGSGAGVSCGRARNMNLQRQTTEGFRKLAQRLSQQRKEVFFYLKFACLTLKPHLTSAQHVHSPIKKGSMATVTPPARRVVAFPARF
jgi:hypothetical protein